MAYFEASVGATLLLLSLNFLISTRMSEGE